MNMWRTSALIFYRAIVMTKVSEYPFLEHRLDNSIYKSVKVLHDGKGISKHHFEAVRSRIPLRQKVFRIDFLSCVVQRNRRMKIARIEGDEYDGASMIYDRGLQFDQHMRFLFIGPGRRRSHSRDRLQ